MRINLLTNLFLFSISLISCNGLLYPKIIYNFRSQSILPPFAVDQRFKQADLDSNEIILDILRGGNEFKYGIHFLIFVDTPYSFLEIDSMKLKWDNKSIVLIENQKYKLPKQVSTELKDNCYYTQKGYYWTQYLSPYSDKDEWPIDIRFDRIFKNSKVDNSFLCKIEIKYSFDNREKKEIFYDYFITPLSNNYVSPFNF